MAIQFDPANKRIILDTTYVTVEDVYSRWKEWARTGDNLKWLPAFSVVGGDPLGGGLFVASYFFLLNGWRLRPMEADQTLEIKGNINVAGGGIPTVRTLGTFNVSVQYTVPVAAQGISVDGGSTGGGGGASVNEITAAIRAELFPELQKLRDLEVVNGKIQAVCEGGSDVAGAEVRVWDGTSWVIQ